MLLLLSSFVLANDVKMEGQSKGIKIPKLDVGALDLMKEKNEILPTNRSGSSSSYNEHLSHRKTHHHRSSSSSSTRRRYSRSTSRRRRRYRSKSRRRSRSKSCHRRRSRSKSHRRRSRSKSRRSGSRSRSRSRLSDPRRFHRSSDPSYSGIQKTNTPKVKEKTDDSYQRVDVKEVRVCKDLFDSAIEVNYV